MYNKTELINVWKCAAEWVRNNYQNYVTISALCDGMIEYASKDDDNFQKVGGWQPIETAPKDNKRPLRLACFNEDGSIQTFDYDGSWESESESWELPEVYHYWATANGNVEEPSHWMYQPRWFANMSVD